MHLGRAITVNKVTITLETRTSCENPYEICNNPDFKLLQVGV